jgi:hypothetical protein
MPLSSTFENLVNTDPKFQGNRMKFMPSQAIEHGKMHGNDGRGFAEVPWHWGNITPYHTPPMLK